MDGSCRHDTAEQQEKRYCYLRNICATGTVCTVYRINKMNLIETISQYQIVNIVLKFEGKNNRILFLFLMKI